MARIRTIKPGLFDDPELNSLTFAARWLFTGLFCQADRSGRMLDEPLRIKARILPYDNVDADKLLAQLESGGFIVRYESGGKRLLQVTHFDRHQRPHPKEAESEFPAPNKHKRSVKRPSREKVRRGRGKVMSSKPDTGYWTMDTGDLDTGGSLEVNSKPTPRAAVLTFACVGQKATWPLDASQVAAWATVYPNLDVLAECRRANAYIEANPSKRKTAGGMPRFLVAWLNRSTDSGRGSSQPAVSQDAEVLRRFVARGENT